MKHKLLIIGSGPAGLTAAIYAARADLKPILFEGSQPGGQLMGTSMVENWPSYEEIMGPSLMLKMRSQAEKLGTILKNETVIKVEHTEKDNSFTVTTDKQTYQAISVIVATGSNPKKINCPGEAQYWGKGVTTCAVCDGAFYKNKPVAIIGGGDTAMEDASFMTRFTDDITLIQILDKLTASKALQKRVLDNPKIKIIYNSSVTKFMGNGEHLQKLTFKNMLTDKEEELAVDAAFIAIGLKPNTSFLPESIKKTEYGHVIAENCTSKSSIAGLFVAGDVIDPLYRQAITAAGSGCKAALDAERYLSGLV